MTRTSLRLAALVSALALPLSAQTVTTTLLNDTFADDERATQDLPDSAKWLTSISSGLSVSGKQLTQTLSSSSSYPVVLAYFTESGAATSLSIGSSLSLTFDVTFTSPSTTTGGFRFGFFDSSAASARKTGDSFSRVDATFADYTGYFTTATLSGGPASRVYERGGTDLIGGNLNNHAQVGSNGAGGKSFVGGTVYSTAFILSRTGTDTLSLSVSYTGVFSGDTDASTVSHTVSDTVSPSFAFDAVSFYAHGTGTTGAFTLDNIKIDYTSLATVPEPASAAALLGAFALSAVAARRRRRV